MKLAIKLKSEFPSELRPAIDMAKAMAENFDVDNGKRSVCDKDWERANFHPKTPAQQFYIIAYSSVINFLCGRPVNSMWLRDGKQKFRSVKRLLFWCGADADVDTQDQIELVVRIFSQTLLGGGPYQPSPSPPSRAKMVPFYPLLIGLLREYRDWKFGDDFFKRDDVNDKDFFERERINEGIKSGIEMLLVYATEEEVDIELRAQSLAAFEQFRTLKIDLAKYEKLDDICGYIVSRGRQQKISIDLAQTQLRLLMKLDTDIVIYLYSQLNYRKWHDFRMFEFVWDMVTLHYPHSLLGLAFHWDHFANACKIFGAEKARLAMDNRIKSALTQSMKEEDSGKSTNMLQILVLEAAEYADVSLDGLYTLIRFDPEVALSGTRKRQSFSYDSD